MHCLNVLVIVLMPGDLSFQPENLSPNILPYQDGSFGLLFPCFQDPPNWPPCNFSRVLICHPETQFRNYLCLVAQSCLTLCNPMDCSPPDPLSMGFSRQEYWSSLPMPSSKGSSQLRDWTQVSCIAGGFFTSWATKEARELNKTLTKNLEPPLVHWMLPFVVTVKFKKCFVHFKAPWQPSNNVTH